MNAVEFRMEMDNLFNHIVENGDERLREDFLRIAKIFLERKYYSARRCCNDETRVCDAVVKCRWWDERMLELRDKRRKRKNTVAGGNPWFPEDDNGN